VTEEAATVTVEQLMAMRDRLVNESPKPATYLFPTMEEADRWFNRVSVRHGVERWPDIPGQPITMISDDGGSPST
jgi:hypothetical protein